MRILTQFELGLLVLGPFDQEAELYIYQGYVMNERYIFFVEEGTLWLRHVQKVANIDHFYIDGDTGGLILAEHITGDAKEMLESIVDKFSEMDALTFLTDVLLWTPDRVDMNLKLDRFQ
ncbi:MULTISPECIES: hypothetical protein [unclassified Paenibacillus]|uniref:hypothetical protein n=1 Tax=unclassified Paenibacillus TaxID=185978 RepID=UPI001F1DC1C2|nr:hypothetical protein [Paenibacillus sp. JJ-223]CAH1195660.1 hypothetical protein PAECIP111890_00793 [Paenibacillus sp. JJ-223]